MTSKAFFIDNTTSTNNGSAVNVYLNPPFQLDINKKYKLSMVEFNFCYCFPNIITGVNDQFVYSYNSTPHTYTLPQGLYSFTDLQNAINTITVSQVGISNLFTFTYSTVSGKTSIAMSANTQITCGKTYAISLFGFVYSRNLLYNPPNVAFVSDQSAQFNSVKSVNVYCDMITGSYQNNNQSNLLGVVTVNAKPFNIQTFDAVQLMSVPVVFQDMIFNFSIYLTDDKGNQLDFTNGNTLNTQYWNIKLRLDEI